ncbi:MAG: biopolymer transporter ExbD [Pirellulaceae bacterium]|jgi:biopolymer transport protein ExbD|nr:biopolymer transporter ExbD [Thermoguttaceae bacterium]MDI9444572.1 biopolymer transporter ExbD [Planctomycetota bacterium]NLZ00153.1 biopolymer transporter ExbD [Pirellulaceae bacterium]
MSQAELWDQQTEEGHELAKHRPVSDDVEIDITPMIDCVFLLLIFFIICSTMSKASSVQLPPARHGQGVDEQTSVIITIDGEGGEAKPRVYLGDGTSGEPLPDDRQTQERLITEAVEQGMQSGKSTILVKAAKAVKSGDVERVSSAAAAGAEGASFHIGVFEAQ